jgi:hypothetical protein
MSKAPLLPILALSAVLPLVLAACSGGGAGGESQAQPPVIVVQAPPEPGSDSYAGVAWQTPTAGSATDPQVAEPGSEPYDVIALLREFDPQLTDAPKDQQSENGADDLLSAFAVMDDTYLYGRLVTRAPVAGDEGLREARFWLEQGEAMVTVEVKVGTTDRPCELSDAKVSEAQKVVQKCFWVGNALDFRVPLDSIPPSIETSEPYWVSGFQTCCSDAERNKPWDEIEGAQEVWRVPQEGAAAPAAGSTVGEDATPAPAEAAPAAGEAPAGE